MSLYQQYLLPPLLERAMNNRTLARERGPALEPVHGEVLEIGFGTGLNLLHYPAGVTHLTAVDPSRYLPQLVRRRIQAAPMPIDLRHASAEQLPFDAGRFDFVVSTWTLCSIPDADAAVREIRRVLRPGGTFVFLEHGRSDDLRIARWQDRVNPFWRPATGGCNLNRQIDRLIEASGMHLSRLDRFRMPKTWPTHGEMYRGSAQA